METESQRNRKRRVNHNEIEKQRRDQQRLRLEILRQHIPTLKETRPSAVTIISEATTLVQGLTARVHELENFIIHSGLQPPNGRDVPPANNYISAPEAPHTLPGEVLFNFLQQNNFGSSSSPERTKSPQKKENFIYDSNFAHIRPKQGSITRRDSAMLLPTKDPNTFLFGKRDSIQNLFTGGLPEMFQDALGQSIACSKCSRGVENLIMIDCDRCHSWYHIRCVGIEPLCIPLQWSCAECARKV